MRARPTDRTAALALLVLASACEARGRRDRSADGRASRELEPAMPYQAEVEEGLGAAVAILIDTSGSMRNEAPGDSRPKSVVAQEALEAMLDATDAFAAKRPDCPIKIGGPQKCSFLKEVGGDVIGAGTGPGLRKALNQVYQGRILAEAPVAGEREPARK